MNTSDNKTLIPESVVYVLFNQVKQSSDEISKATKELGIIVRELAKNITTPPTNNDVIHEIKEQAIDIKNEHEKIGDSINTHDQRDEQRVGKVHDRFDGVVTNADCAPLHDELHCIRNSVHSLKKWVVTMILVTTISFALMTTSYLYVRNGIQQTVNQSIERALMVGEK